MSSSLPTSLFTSTMSHTQVTVRTIPGVHFSRRSGTPKPFSRSSTTLPTCGFGIATSLLGELHFPFPTTLTDNRRSGKRLPREDNRITVDLDAEEGKPAKSGRGNKHTVHLRWTRQVDFSGLGAFLSGQASWSTECIDTINFLDHLLREGPSRQYTKIKNSFFQRGEQRFDLGGGIEAFKGVFASLRPVLDDKFNKALAINVDVANGTFWRSQELTRVSLRVNSSHEF